MTAYRTCLHCVRARDLCERRADVARGVAGLGVTSVKFRCPERIPLFTPGQRVSVTWFIVDPDGRYGDGIHETWPATVIAQRGTKFQIVVDDVDGDEGTPARGWMKNESLHAKVTVGKLRPLSEPDRKLCPDCDGVIQSDGTVPGCWQVESSRCAMQGQNR